MAIRVGDLFLGLGVVPDLDGFKAGDTAIDRTVAKLSKLGQMAKQVQRDLERTSKDGIVPVGQLGKTRESLARERSERESAKLALRVTRDNAAAEAKLGRERQRSADKLASESKAKREKDIGDAKHNLGALADRIAVALTAAAVGAAYGLYSMAKGAFDLAKNLEDSTKKTGLNAEALQQWHYAAKLGGADAGEFDKGLTILSKNMNVAAKTGKGPAVDAFTDLGLSMNDPAIRSRDLNKILFLVSNKFSTMPDGAKKTAIAMQLFGRAGADMIPVLDEGVGALAAQRAELKALGGVLDNDAVSAFANLDDQLERVHVAVDGVFRQGIALAIPTVKALVDDMLEWIKANKELLAQRVAEFIRGASVALRLFGDAVKFAVKHWGVLSDLLITGGIILGIYKIAQAIMFFQKILKLAAVQAAIEWVIMLGPIAWVAAAVVALGALMYVFRDDVGNALDSVGDFFTELWTSITNGLKNSFEWLADLPVIKQLIWLVTELRDLIGKNTGFDGRTQEQVNQQAADSSGGSEADALFGPSGYYQTGATGPTASSAPARTSTGAVGSAASVTNSYSIQIDAKNADAREVAALVDDKIKEHDERTRRDTGAALGVVGVT